jgi:hypothetical protein
MNVCSQGDCERATMPEYVGPDVCWSKWQDGAFACELALFFVSLIDDLAWW